MLDALGTDSLIGEVYAALITHPNITVEDLVSITNQPAQQIAAVLDELHRSDLAAENTLNSDSGRRTWEAQAPDGAAADLLHNYERRLDVARNAHHQLTKMFWLARRGSAHYPGLEVIRNPAVAREQVRILEMSVTTQIRGLDRGPYLQNTAELQLPRKIDLQIQRMSEGIPYRVIYDSRDLPAHPTLMECIAAGEQARSLADLPLKMIMADSQCAALPLDPAGITDGATLIVHPSALLTALEGIFETFWDLALPVAHPFTDNDNSLTGLQCDVLALLAAGATDSQIAAKLNLSRSTVVRTCSTLFQTLGANTRFQAGIYAQRQGWLG